MAAQHVAPQHRVQALWERPSGRRRDNRAARIAVALSVGAHAALGVYLYKTKFEPAYRAVAEAEVTTVIIDRAPSKPQVPPEPAEIKREAPAPKPEIAPRPALMPPSDFTGPTIPLSPPELPPTTDLAPSEPVRPPVMPTIVNPDWSSRPTAEDMERFYPERAKRLDQSGRATLQCRITAKGSVADCSVLAEDPMGYGFGEAALKLSKLFRMKPKLQDGQAVEGAAVKIPIAFRITN